MIDLIDGLPFCRGAAIKYLFRAGTENPSKELEDLAESGLERAEEIGTDVNTRSKWKSRKLMADGMGGALGLLDRASRARELDVAWVQVSLALTAIVAVYVSAETWIKKYLDPDSALQKRKEE